MAQGGSGITGQHQHTQPLPAQRQASTYPQQGHATQHPQNQEQGQPEGSRSAQADQHTRQATQSPQQTLARYTGCLLGGAVGDALGAPIEFMSATDILLDFGPMGVTNYQPAYGGLGLITDDTQMTLFTADGLLRAWIEGHSTHAQSQSRGHDRPQHHGHPPEHDQSPERNHSPEHSHSQTHGHALNPVRTTALAYLHWLQTQGESPALSLDPTLHGWLFAQEALHARRAPGMTCLSSLRSMDTLGAPARNNSKGCGGVMRVAPVGLFAHSLHLKPQQTFQLGNRLAGLTHGHPTGQLTGGALAVFIQGLAGGVALRNCLPPVKALLRATPDHEETLHAIEQAESLAGSDLPHAEAIKRLGQGWIAEEALAVSLYCALVAQDFKHGVKLAVNHDGDSDSTGAIAGNLLGALYGESAIPAKWLQPLELRGVITEVARDLHDFHDWQLDGAHADAALAQRLRARYPVKDPLQKSASALGPGSG